MAGYLYHGRGASRSTAIPEVVEGRTWSDGQMCVGGKPCARRARGFRKFLCAASARPQCERSMFYSFIAKTSVIASEEPESLARRRQDPIFICGLIVKIGIP